MCKEKQAGAISCKAFQNIIRTFVFSFLSIVDTSKRLSWLWCEEQAGRQQDFKATTQGRESGNNSRQRLQQESEWKMVPRTRTLVAKMGASQVAQWERIPLPMKEMQVWSLGREEPMEKELATHSSTLVWEIPWTEKPGGLQSMGSQRVRNNWSDAAASQLLAMSWHDRDDWLMGEVSRTQ